MAAALKRLVVLCLSLSLAPAFVAKTLFYEPSQNEMNEKKNSKLYEFMNGITRAGATGNTIYRTHRVKFIPLCAVCCVRICFGVLHFVSGPSFCFYYSNLLSVANWN